MEGDGDAVLGALTSVAYASDDVLCAVGGSFSSGEIIRSKDGGKSWDEVDCPVETELDAICFTSAKEGWAAGIDGVILQTRDAGQTWKLVDTETSDQFLAGMAAQGGRAWIVGSGGCILSNFNFKGGRGLSASAPTLCAPVTPVGSNKDDIEGAHSAAQAVDSLPLGLGSRSTAVGQSRRLARAASDHGKAGHASTDIFLDFPDADHDDDYNESSRSVSRLKPRARCTSGTFMATRWTRRSARWR